MSGRFGKLKTLIDGELVESASGQWLESVDPATEQVIGYVPLCDRADAERAIAAAQAAAPAWRDLGVAGRAAKLRELAARLLERSQELLDIEVADTGSTVGKMRGDVGHTIGSLEQYAGLGLEMKGETIPASVNHLHMTVRQPFGVVGRIVPFNHPLYFSLGGSAAPLMAGNTLVVKPPEQSPLSSAIMSEICRDVLPKGVMNVLNGVGAGIGDAIVRHPGVRRIAFIGSVPTGLAIQRAAAESAVKHLTLELGGKNPMIVFPDVDVDQAVTAAFQGMNFAWSGQSCGSTSRLLVHDSIYDDVVQRLAARIDAVKLGMPADPSSEMGPINSKAHYERVLRYIEYGKEDGATLMAGGVRPDGDDFARGYWVRPTLFGNVTPDMRIAKEEIFGPVLSALRWSNIDEALRIANGTEYGLTASIWTNDLKTALRTAQKVESGYIWVNGASSHHRGTPFGGLKNSGIGRDEGLEELLSYTEQKAIHIAL
ncbi:aldehyde dehydrogenase family protein [Sphingobium fuliginis]|jgi:acyl-CoA reductase-like NAD-dependent aldehyde dehydrogenase|uniref:Aldehyde dehydrogenase family protein n=1 Tax=Sphingobium fuliginis (strain ATCC 27551) TaxID=336203 RepID=A0A7M2GN74_SPHSA|nr:aldehyde dehydrogenase family protein [Sphingobium fuliginis]QOT73963.1 aldehyde dehydrogenase family protein [Sphingobium fuliginis]